MDAATLAHYGVKGMRWGVRRTPVQLGHRTKSKTAKQIFRNAKSEKQKTDASSSSKKAAHELSDAELREAIGRLELERRYKELSRNPQPAKTDAGRKFVNNILAKSGENIGTQFATYVMGTLVNKIAGEEIVNPRKGQK